MRAAKWRDALNSLEELEAPDCWGQTRLNVWRAKCYLQLSEPIRSVELLHEICGTPLERGVALRSFASLILAKSLVKLGATPVAMQILVKATKDAPNCPPLRKMLADLVLNVNGDWALAATVLKPLQGDPHQSRALEAFRLNRQRYVGSPSPQTLTNDTQYFARSYFPPAAPRGSDTAGHQRLDADKTHRKRIGLISTMFHASPVYFLCIGALKLLAREFDLVFFSRDERSGWAKEEFRAIASEWHDTGSLSAGAITAQIKKAQLHALVDLAGWLDITVLEALASKPAPLQIKWVGGQSSTTGSTAYDAYVSDIHQSPPGLSPLYTEPLAYMPGGYVSYTPPPYMPAPSAPSEASEAPLVGIVSHPKKLSAAFLAYLRQQIGLHNQAEGGDIGLRFIGWHYGSEQVQSRLQKAMCLDNEMTQGSVHVSYSPSKNHTEQLESISRLDWIVDTFPYTGGLTALEALALGVPYRTHAGQHFATRHAYSHARFAPIEPQHFHLESLGVFKTGSLKKSGQSLLKPDSPRLDHNRLARDLAKLLHSPARYVRK